MKNDQSRRKIASVKKMVDGTLVELPRSEWGDDIDADGYKPVRGPITKVSPPARL